MYLAFFTLILLIPAYWQTLILKNGFDYGPYVIDITHFGLCAAIKLQNLTEVTVHFEKKPNHEFVADTNVTFHNNNTRFDTINLSVFRNDDESNVLWRYKVTKPCQHPIIMPIMMRYYNIDRHCNIKKGTYFPQLLLLDQAKAFLGEQFFYGEFTFKVTVLSKKYTILCVVVKCNFAKKVVAN